MNASRLVVVCGVRPQYVKVAALLHEWRSMRSMDGHQHPDPIVFDTRQHYDDELAGDFQRDLGLIPNVVLEHAHARSNDAIIAHSLTSLCRYIREDHSASATLLVFGDANPTLVGTLAAQALGVQLIHVEAGERRGHHEQEHFNTRVADLTAGLALCVTSRAVANLESEGYRGRLVRTGDMAARWLDRRVAAAEREGSAPLAGPCNLVTIHRPQNVAEQKLAILCHALGEQGVPTRWIVHPRTREILDRMTLPDNIQTIEPRTHTELLRELASATRVLTDSGGIAREAYLVGKPLVVFRSEGSWDEIFDDGHARRVDWSESSIRSALAWRPSACERTRLTRSGGIDLGITAIASFLSATGR